MRRAPLVVPTATVKAQWERLCKFNPVLLLPATGQTNLPIGEEFFDDAKPAPIAVSADDTRKELS
jgi:hypothetical protein